MIYRMENRFRENVEIHVKTKMTLWWFIKYRDNNLINSLT